MPRIEGARFSCCDCLGVPATKDGAASRPPAGASRFTSGPQARIAMQFKRQKALRVAGIFAGIGGFEVGLERAGHKSVLLCENDSAAQAVLRERFKRRLLIADVAEIESVPGDVDLLAAGFPCQDLSQVDRKHTSEL